MRTSIMWHNRFSENKNEAVEAYIWDRDLKTKKPQHRDSKIKKTMTSIFGTKTP